MSDFSLERIQAALGSGERGIFGARIVYYDQIRSTNDVAREMAAQGMPEGTLVIADEQTAGRGRMGRTWTAAPGTSLLMSILFRPTLPPVDAYRLVMVVGLAYADACERKAGQPIQVKWPNDFLCGGKKVAGILAESAIEDQRLLWVIVGVGLNVNQVFEPSDPLAGTATSLRMCRGTGIDRVELLEQIMSALHHWYAQLHKPALIEAWRARCMTLGQRVTVAAARGNLTGWAEDVDATGALCLRTEDGTLHRLTAGEATLSAG